MLHALCVAGIRDRRRQVLNFHWRNVTDAIQRGSFATSTVQPGTSDAGRIRVLTR